jgi:hypothetical protein
MVVAFGATRRGADKSTGRFGRIEKRPTGSKSLGAREARRMELEWWAAERRPSSVVGVLCPFSAHYLRDAGLLYATAVRR